MTRQENNLKIENRRLYSYMKIILYLYIKNHQGHNLKKRNKKRKRKKESKIQSSLSLDTLGIFLARKNLRHLYLFPSLSFCMLFSPNSHFSLLLIARSPYSINHGHITLL